MREAWDEKGRLIYVAPGCVRYDILHVEFLLPMLPELREGIGPEEPLGGYVGGSRGSLKQHAPHEAWCQVAAELDERLTRTKTDRYLVEHYYYHNTSIEDIARQIEMEPWEVQRRIRSAVGYIASGACRRWVHCVDCREYSSCERENKGRVGLTYREWVRRGGRGRRPSAGKGVRQTI
jgi:AraC-like DNA-binding protein